MIRCLLVRSDSRNMHHSPLEYSTFPRYVAAANAIRLRMCDSEQTHTLQARYHELHLRCHDNTSNLILGESQMHYEVDHAHCQSGSPNRHNN